MNISDKVAVCSRSFSKNEVLRSELLRRYKYVTFKKYLFTVLNFYDDNFATILIVSKLSSLMKLE